MDRKSTFDAIVVGGGIAGLAGAWDLRDRDVLLLESAERLGGRIRSEARGDVWLNFGAHVFGGPGSVTDRLLAEAGRRGERRAGQARGGLTERQDCRLGRRGNLPVPPPDAVRIAGRPRPGGPPSPAGGPALREDR